MEIIMNRQQFIIALQTYVESKKKKLNLWREYNDPFYHWLKVRKYWKCPKLHLYHIGKVIWMYGMPTNIEMYNKHFDILLSGLGWKDKDNEPRFEWNPFLAITFFRKWQIVFTWNFCKHFMGKDLTHAFTANEMTWETILWMTEFHKNIADACYLEGTYSDYSPCDDPDCFIPPRSITAFRNMTKYGFEQYYQTPRSKQLKENKCF